MTKRLLVDDPGIDLRNTLLPSRACLLAIRDTMCHTRRLGLEDALHEARRAARKHRGRDDGCIASLALIWEAVSCLELAANVAAPWVDPQLDSPNGPWVQMTYYDGGRATRFYESSHKWTDQRFAVLSAHTFRHGDDTTMLDALHEMSDPDPRIVSAYTAASEATVRLLRQHFATLAVGWKQMRAYAAAYEHGLLFVPESVGEVVNEHEAVVPHAVVAWETRKDATRGLSDTTLADVIERVNYVGHLAIDLASHVADARLRVTEAIEIDPDGSVWLMPWPQAIPYWVRKNDLSEEHREVLDGLRITWIEEDDEPGQPATG